MNAYQSGFAEGHKQGHAEGVIEGKRQMLATFETPAKDRRAQLWFAVLAVGGFVAALVILMTMK